MERSKRIIVTTDASGAQQAAQEGLLVVIVDIIDMSTTLESALDAGAYAVLGCSPDFTRAPAEVDPERIGREAGRLATDRGCGIILVGEPRVGSQQERLSRCQKVIRGIEKEKGIVERVLPNLGAETPKLAEMKDKIVVAVTDTGGVAFDAAFQKTDRVITATVARTLGQKGMQPALSAVKRIEENMGNSNGVALVAASRNSMEDILAAQFIASLLIR